MALTYLTHGGGILENIHINHIYTLTCSLTHTLHIHCGEEPAVREREREKVAFCKHIYVKHFSSALLIGLMKANVIV